MLVSSKKLLASSSQWESRLPEAAIDSVMMLLRPIIVDFGLGGRFWFKFADAGCEPVRGAECHLQSTNPPMDINALGKE